MKTLLDPVAWLWFGALAMALARFWPAGTLGSGTRRGIAGKGRGANGVPDGGGSMVPSFADELAAVGGSDRGKRRTSFVLLGLVLITGLAQGLRVHARLLHGLERPYLGTGHHLAPADAVVVLGGNLSAFRASYLGLEASDSVDRVLTAVALLRDGKGRALVLGGGHPVGDPPSEAETAKAWLKSWKLVSVPIASLEACANTRAEALQTAELARANGWRRIILVSSAWHLNRATGAFRKVGLEVIPVGCDFRGTTALRNQEVLPFVPRTTSLVLYNLWVQEVVGYGYYRAKSWL